MIAKRGGKYNQCTGGNNPNLEQGTGKETWNDLKQNFK